MRDKQDCYKSELHLVSRFTYRVFTSSLVHLNTSTILRNTSISGRLSPCPDPQHLCIDMGFLTPWGSQVSHGNRAKM